MNKGLLILLVGPSGSGKGTVLKELLKDEKNTFLSVSATTRKPRPGEIDGVNYFFMDKVDFEKLRDENGLLEYATYCDNFYGTPKAPILERLCKGENVILEIEMQGAKQVKSIYNDALTIFILPPSIAELKSRLFYRNTESEEVINKRLQTAIDEIKYAKSCDYIVINDTVEQAALRLRSIITANIYKTKNMTDFLDRLDTDTVEKSQ